jgi:hypothetical protein
VPLAARPPGPEWVSAESSGACLCARCARLHGRRLLPILLLRIFLSPLLPAQATLQALSCLVRAVGSPISIEQPISILLSITQRKQTNNTFAH